MLTEHQLAHFNTFGFVPLRGLFSKDEIDNFNDEFQLKLESTLRCTGLAEDPAKYCSWSSLGSETPHSAKIHEDSRILSIAEQLLGDDFVIRSCNCGSYVNVTPWHPDSINFHEHTIKFPIYLQPLDDSNGALRLIPGSHRKPFHEAILNFGLLGLTEKASHTEFSISDIPAYSCNMELGDVFIFDCHIWHASWGGNTDRRMISPIYTKNPKTADEEAMTREQVKNNYSVREELAKDTYAERQPEYPLDWLANTDKDPRRQHWIDYLTKWGYIESFQEVSDHS